MNYYTGDSHYNHRNIISYSSRPFANVEEMNEALVDGINGVVGERDTLYHLGDVAFGLERHRRSQLESAIEFRKRIRCRHVILVWGNHDKRLKSDLGFRAFFDRTGDLLEITDHFLKRKVVLCHFALVVYNASHHGQTLHAFGHSHGNLNSWLDEHMPGHLAMDVGVDNAYKLLGEYRPFSSEEFGKFVLPRAKFRTKDYPLCVPS
jgi:calcineurin-like phosphoesterase family protein